MKLKHVLWLVVGVCVAQDNSTDLGVAPVAPPPITFCKTDEDCRAFADLGATCSDNACHCNYEEYLTINDLKLCIYLGAPSQVLDVHFITKFTRGDCPDAKASLSVVQSEYAQAMNSYLTGAVDGYDVSYNHAFYLCGSVYMAGSAKVQAVDALSIINNMANGLESEFARGTYATSNKALNPSDGIVVSASFGANECDAPNARSSIFINTYCCALECIDGYTLRQENDFITFCKREKSEINAAEIGALVVGCLWGCLMLVAIIWFCCIRKKPEPEEEDRELMQMDEEQQQESEEKAVNDPFDEPANDPFNEPAHRQPEPEPEPEPVPEPEPEPVPEPEPEPEPVPEPEPEPEPVPEPEPEPEPEPVPVGMDRDAAGRIIARFMMKWWVKHNFLRSLREWKDREAERKTRIAEGRTGSLNVGVDSAMRVQKCSAGGAASNAGVQVGDVIVMVKTEGRGGRSISRPTPNRFILMEALGPANEVFEKTPITVVVVRDPAAQKKWQEMNLEPPSPEDQAEHDAWVRGVGEVENMELKAEMGAESDKVRENRLKKITKMKEVNNIQNMDVQLVNDFMSDPDKCKDFTRKVYAAADNDGSGVLELDEMEKVFEQMSAHTGTPALTAVQRRRLFDVMDESCDGEVGFSEFYPTFRSHQIRAICKLLEYDEDTAGK